MQTKQINPQTEANKKWQQKNKEKTKYLHSRSVARSFIKNYATLDDLAELQQLMQQRTDFLNHQ